VWIAADHLHDHVWRGNRHWRSLHESMNIWFRIAGTGVACLMILMAGVRASTSITNERERDTFDALITTPLSAEAILGAKLLGNLTSLRLSWVWFGSMLVLAVLTGGLHPVGVPLVIGAWFVYAAFFTMVGLGYSMMCTTSMRASVYTVLTTLVLGGGHWFITGCCCAPIFGLFVGLGVRQREFSEPLTKLGEYFVKFEAGMTPPVVIGLCSFSWQDLDRNLFQQRTFLEFVGFSLLGLCLWALACPLLWFALLLPQFRQISRRLELIFR
jgi:ABC-type transport system involved in multi-copper enzyme maturation permease subunit